MTDSPNPNAGLGRARDMGRPNDLKPTMMARHLRVEGCKAACTLNATRYPPRVGDAIHKWYEDGFNNYAIIAKASLLDVNISHGAVARHRANHLVVYDPADEAPIPEGESEGEAISDIDALSRLISEGSRNFGRKGIKISPELWLRAMELKYKLTQGSVMADTFDAIGREMDGETPDAAESTDEQAQVHSDAAPEIE